MTDAELIYNATLRAERRLERMCEEAATLGRASETPYLVSAYCVVKLLREEIGNGLAREGR